MSDHVISLVVENRENDSVGGSVQIRGLRSTMPFARTNELPIILNTLRHAQDADYTVQDGFDYTLPFRLAEEVGFPYCMPFHMN